MKKKTKRNETDFKCPCCYNPHGQCQFITYEQNCSEQHCDQDYKNIEKQDVVSIFVKISNFIAKHWDMIFYLSIAIIPIGCISIFSYKSGQISGFVLTIVIIIWSALWCAYFVGGM